jgi:hypothetical protein
MGAILLIVNVPITTFRIDVLEVWSGPWVRIWTALRMYWSGLLDLAGLVAAGVATRRGALRASGHSLTGRKMSSSTCVDLGSSTDTQGDIRMALFMAAPLWLVLPIFAWGVLYVASGTPAASIAGPYSPSDEAIIALGRILSGWIALVAIAIYVGCVAGTNLKRVPRTAEYVSRLRWCQRCGYSLEGLAPTVCPECGAATGSEAAA